MVSIGFMQATPGDMKSFRSSAERIALIFGEAFAQRVGTTEGWKTREWVRGAMRALENHEY